MRARTIAIHAAAAIFAVALVQRFHALGGPYFQFPETIQDHVSVTRYPSRDVIVLARRAAEIIPRGATVTALQPSHDDPTLYLTAVGMMPRHRVVRPDLAKRPEYVLAVREPLADPAYRVLREFPEGRVYVLAP